MTPAILLLIIHLRENKIYVYTKIHMQMFLAAFNLQQPKAANSHVHQHMNCYGLNCVPLHGGFPGGSDHKESACSVGDLGSIPGLGRSPGERNGNSL